ncbi:MAG: sigma-70 family RNA polymerase sigma factor [Acidimicrobiia bacterium]|nr:sigma-70 family RNA polymerase sigma factor [Acidimicrobiia bacterium]
MRDRAALRRFRAGDPEAVRVLYDRYGRAVFAVAFRALGDRSLAEEAVQQTFLQAWRAADRFDVGRDPAPWLYAIARRVAVDLYRRERRHNVVDLDRLSEIAVLPESFEGTWEAWQVRLAIDQLSAEEREVVRCTHYLGLTQAETAERLEIPLGTVKSRTFRAYRNLADSLTHVIEVTA